MKVTVEIITGTFLDTVVNENATVKELKENIATEVKLPVKRLILMVGDEENRRIVMDNEDEIMLKDLGVIEDSHMYLFFKHPDLVSEEERSRGEGGDDDTPIEAISSEAESRRGNEEEEEEKANINGHEKEVKARKIEEEKEDRDEKVEEDRDEKIENEEEEKEENGEEKDDDVGKEEARESEDGDKKVET